LALADAQSIRDRIGEIYRNGYVLGEDDVRYPIAPIAVASWRGEFVRDLCVAERATSSVEVGMAWGLSTLHIIEALLANASGEALLTNASREALLTNASREALLTNASREALLANASGEALLANGASGRAHVVIDPMQTSLFHNAARRTLRECGVDAMVEFYEAPSDLILPKLISEGRRFDFAFIDGDHHFESVFLDAVFVDRLLKPGGVVAFDDAWSHPVYLACKFLEVYFHYAPVSEQLKPPGDVFAGEMKHRRRHDPAFGAALPKMRAYRKPQKSDAEKSDSKDVELDFSRFALADANLPGPIAYWHARRLTTLGLRALSEGRHDEARSALATALRINPTRLKSYTRLLRTMLPSWMARRLSGHTGRGDKVRLESDRAS
jgi:predicted O-methyltransferase YrrM